MNGCILYTFTYGIHMVKYICLLHTMMIFSAYNNASESIQCFEVLSQMASKVKEEKQTF